MPREATIEDIDEIQAAFAASASRVKLAGYEGIEIHGAHGYLLLSFLSPYTNKRTDFYGGSFENRARFPLEVVDRVIEAVGHSFPLIYRISGQEYVPGGLTIDETTKFAKMLMDIGVDCIHVSGGIYEVLYRQTPPMYLPRNANIPSAVAMKKVVDVPIITAGGITVAEEADELVAQGKTDLVAMGRAFFCDQYCSILKWCTSFGIKLYERFRSFNNRANA